MTTATQITNTNIFAFIAVLVLVLVHSCSSSFMLWIRKVLFINRKNNRICWLLFKKRANVTGKLQQNYK